MKGIQANNKRIAKNTAFLYLRMFLVLVVSLYTSRVVLNTLGVSDFGVYSVVGGFVSLFGFLNSTLSSSMSRFYNYEGGCRGEEGIKDVYTSGFWIHVILAVVIFIMLETFGLWYINNIMVIPQGRLFAANVLFQYSVFSMSFVILQIPYTSVIMSYERMDFYALVSIIDVFLKLIIVIALPYLPFDKLITYATLTLIVAIANFLFFYIYAKREFETIKLNKHVNKLLFKSFLSFSGWNLIGTFTYMLKGQGVNMILNVFFGTIINAARGVAYQINNALSGFSQNISTAFRPQIVDSYSKNNQERVIKMLMSESKVCYYLILVMIIPVILEIDYILKLWLGDAIPEYANIFSVLVLIDMLICSLNAPVTQVTFATGNIKKYQIANSSLNILLLPICWLFLVNGFESYTVFIITIVFSIINQIVCLACMKSVFPFRIKNYINNVVYPLFALTIMLPIIPFVIRVNFVPSFIRLVFITITEGLLALILGWFVILNKEEKRLVKEFVHK